MTKPFVRSAEFYDTIHASKNYDAETEKIARFFVGSYGMVFRPRVFDIGCGTGEFARRLPAYGCEVIGLDSSEEMVAIARRKGVDARKVNIFDFIHNQKADAAICMFGAFSYITASLDRETGLQRTLQAIRGMLNRGGAFVFDTLHALAPLREKDYAVFGEGENKIARCMVKNRSPETGIITHDITYSHKGEWWTERHEMQSFTVPELRYALNHCGFNVRQIICEEWDETFCTMPSYYLTVFARAK